MEQQNNVVVVAVVVIRVKQIYELMISTISNLWIWEDWNENMNEKENSLLTHRTFTLVQCAQTASKSTVINIFQIIVNLSSFSFSFAFAHCFISHVGYVLLVARPFIIFNSIVFSHIECRILQEETGMTIRVHFLICGRRNGVGFPVWNSWNFTLSQHKFTKQSRIFEKYQ